MRVLFMGNHSVGVRCLRTLVRVSTVVGVVANPADPEDGIRYESVAGFAEESHIAVLRGSGRDLTVIDFVRSCAPDLIWIADYRYILPPSILEIPRLGAVNLHPSLLPAYRGRAPINWAILNGETRLGLTAHYVDVGVDTGDIIRQEAFDFGPHMDVSDALRILYPLYESMTSLVIGDFNKGSVNRRPQDHKSATQYPARKPEDGRVDWTQSAERVRNLIRAVTHPYPGAFGSWPAGKIFLWKASVGSPARARPGTVMRAGRGSLIIACMDFELLVSDYTGALPPSGVVLN